VNKFIKWIDVKPASSITVAKVVEFIRDIMYLFGVANNIITDNGTQFTARELKDFCAYSGIKINNASVSHLQSNGQVEHSNGMILPMGPTDDRVEPRTTYHSHWYTILRQCYPPR
jgi:transposase InsO family protein